MNNSLMIIPEEVIKVLTEAEVNLMFDAVDDDLRIEVMLKIMWYTGVRNTELRMLQDKDVDTKNQRITFISLKKRGIKDFKYAPRKTIDITKELTSLLKKYRSTYMPKDYFFFPLYKKNLEFGVIGDKNKPITKQGLSFIINKVAIKAGVQETHEIKKRTHDKKGKPLIIEGKPTLIMRKVTPHTFRHSAATFIQRKGKDMELTRSILDHSSLTSTQKYLHYTQEDKKEKLMEIFG